MGSHPSNAIAIQIHGMCSVLHEREQKQPPQNVSMVAHSFCTASNNLPLEVLVLLLARVVENTI